jgi:monoterpene epsilon-lactone hydrolase
MVMGRRDDVETASLPIAGIAVAGLVPALGTALLRVPFRRPWHGRATLAHNVGACVTREVMRTFMGYASSLPIEEFRSLEVVLDDLSGAVLPPLVRRLDDVSIGHGEVGGINGLWYRPKAAPSPVGPATDHRRVILYFHGGGYIGTSPAMYAAFTGALAEATDAHVFVADYRLAPEFPFPADLEDALAVYRAVLDHGVPAERIFVAGDSGGGGLVHSLVVGARSAGLPRPAGVLLFSPEVDLSLDEVSVTENASKDILPWNIPTAAYLHGVEPTDARVSALNAEWTSTRPCWSPTATTRCSGTRSAASSISSSRWGCRRRSSRRPGCSTCSRS